MALAKDYSPDEPRDERGRWARDGGLALGDGRPYGAPFTPEQAGALHAYTEELSGVNGWLRNRLSTFVGATDAMKARAAADAAVMASAARPIPRPMTLYRGTDSLGPEMDAVLEEAADRGLDGDLAAGDHLASLVGEVVRDPGFLSTTTDQTLGKYADAGIQLRISAPAGTPLVNIGNDIGRYGESEQLLPPGTGLRITSVSPASNERGDQWWAVRAKVVP